MEKWEPKFSDTLGMVYNEFCHNLNFKTNSKLKHWSHDDVMVISNNQTDVILDFETGFIQINLILNQDWVVKIFQRFLKKYNFGLVLVKRNHQQVPNGHRKIFSFTIQLIMICWNSIQ